MLEGQGLCAIIKPNLTKNISMKENSAKTGMLIRKPIDEVFNSFIDPESTKNFWFTKSSGKLEVGKQTVWTWEMYNHTVSVFTKEIEPNKRIIIEWGNYSEKIIVEWIFEELGADKTFVTIENFGFVGDTQQILKQISDATEGFTLVLAGLKAYLEFHIKLNLVEDRFPIK